MGVPGGTKFCLFLVGRHSLKGSDKKFLNLSMVGLFWLLAMGFMIGRILFLPQELEQTEAKIVDNVMHNPHFADRFGLNN